MLLNLNLNLKDLQGNDVVENGEKVNLAKLFATILYSSNEENEIKMAEIARKLFNEGSMEIDMADLMKLEEFLSKQQNLSVAAKSPIREAFIKAKESIQR